MLNDQQRAAVQTEGKRVLVAAGAGTGKTLTLASRIAHLLYQGVSSSAILAMTFTRRAASEMAERVASLTGLGALEDLWLGTIHATCFRIIREYGHLVGYPTAPTVYGEDDATFLIESVLERLHVEYSVKQVRQALKTPAPDHALRRVVEEYRRQLRIGAAVDYDGLILTAIELLEREEPRAAYRGRFAHVLVDEAQDLFPGSWAIIEKLSPDNLFMVGDDAQSIFQFLGASIERFLGCVSAGFAVHTLTQNYRCTGAILNLGNAILAKNVRQIQKTLVTEKAGEPVALRGFPDDEAEALWVASESRRLREGGRAWNEIAILCRTNALVERFADHLTRAEVPVQAVGAVDPFATPTGRLVGDMLRLTQNPGDELSLRRLLVTAGLEVHRLAGLELARHQRGVSLLAAALELPGTSAARLCLALSDGAGHLAGDAPHAVRLVLDGVRRIPGVAHLGNGVAALPILQAVDEWRKTGGRTVGDLLVFLATKAAIDLFRPAEDAVAVMTIHAAKGLEFPVVFVPGWEEGLLPHRASMGSPASVEEERRVGHVAVTRAADLLVCTWAAERREWNRVLRRNRSRLLDSLEAPQEVAAP